MRFTPIIFKIFCINLFLLGVLMAGNSPIKSVLPKHYQTTLKNGLEVVVIPLENQSDVITTDIFYKVI